MKIITLKKYETLNDIKEFAFNKLKEDEEAEECYAFIILFVDEAYEKMKKEIGKEEVYELANELSPLGIFFSVATMEDEEHYEIFLGVNTSKEYYDMVLTSPEFSLAWNLDNLDFDGIIHSILEYEG